MRNAFAECILSLVTPKDGAGAILGDLLEDQLDSIAFWFSLLRTAISIGMHRPYRLLSKVLGFAIDIAGFAFWMWFYTHVIGLSYLVTALLVIPLELILWFRRRRSPVSAERRTS